MKFRWYFVAMIFAFITTGYAISLLIMTGQQDGFLFLRLLAISFMGLALLLQNTEYRLDRMRRWTI